MADDPSTIPCTRAEALKVGAVHYRGSKPCPKGHQTPERYAKNGHCVLCMSILSRQREKDDPERAREYARRSAERYKERRRERDRTARRTPEHRAVVNARRRKNAVQRREKDKALYYRNPEKHRQKTKAWRERNPEQAKAIRRATYVKRMQRPAVRISSYLSSSIRRLLTTGKQGRKTFDILPYTAADLVAHLERLFQPGMTWENYGSWHIDHVIPLRAFNFESVDHVDFQRAWALSNLQPLWAKDNQSKSGKLSEPFQPSLAI